MDRHEETVAERLQLTLEMFEFGVELKAAKLRRDHPDATPAQIEQMLEDWLAHRPGAEHGDGDGAPMPLDRFR